MGEEFSHHVLRLPPLAAGKTASIIPCPHSRPNNSRKSQRFLAHFLYFWGLFFPFGCDITSLLYTAVVSGRRPGRCEFYGR